MKTEPYSRERIFKEKQKRSLKLARLPFEEKIEILKKLKAIARGIKKLNKDPNNP